MGVVGLQIVTQASLEFNTFNSVCFSVFSFFILSPQDCEWAHSAANVGGRISLRNSKKLRGIARRILVQMSVNSVTLGLKFKPSVSLLCFCASHLLSPFLLFPSNFASPSTPASFTLCSLSFTAFKVHWMQCWYSVVFRLAYSKPSAPGSQHSFTVFVKNFSVSMHHLHISPVFKQKRYRWGLWQKKKRQAVPQFLSHFIFSAL